MADFAKAMAMIIRAQLFGLDNHIVPDSQYNELFAMHGTISCCCSPLDPAARPWQEGAGAAGLHGLTVCDAGWGCVMWDAAGPWRRQQRRWNGGWFLV
jgi:hypothetical protein